MSKKERFGSAQLLGNKNLAYGELTYQTLHKVIHWIEKSQSCKVHGDFWDLGHGTGKGAVAAALAQRFDKVSGVELLDGLFYESLRIKDKYVKSSGDATPIELVQGNYLELDWWTNTDFIYMNSIFEGTELLESIGKLASNMKPGSWFVSSFKPLPNEAGHWEQKLCKYMEMSWGQAPIFIQYKLK